MKTSDTQKALICLALFCLAGSVESILTGLGV